MRISELLTEEGISTGQSIRDKGSAMDTEEETTSALREARKE